MGACAASATTRREHDRDSVRPRLGGDGPAGQEEGQTDPAHAYGAPQPHWRDHRRDRGRARARGGRGRGDLRSAPWPGRPAVTQPTIPAEHVRRAAAKINRPVVSPGLQLLRVCVLPIVIGLGSMLVVLAAPESVRAVVSTVLTVSALACGWLWGRFR